MESELFDAGLSLWREVKIFLRSMTSPWRLYQIGILIALLAVAHILRIFAATRLEAFVRAREGWPKWRLRVTVVVIQRLRGLFFVVLIWITVWIMREVTWPSRSYLLAIAATIATAWIAVSFGAQLIRNKPLRRVVSWGAWIYIGLLYLGFLDGATTFLDSIAVTFDDFRLSALSVLKALVVTGLLFLGAKFALRILISRISRSEDISPSM